MNNTLAGEALLKDWEGVRSNGITQEQRAKELGIPFEIYKTRYYRAMANRRFAKMIDQTPDFVGFDRPDLFDWSLPTEWLFEWEDFVVVGDVQLPTTNYEFAILPAYIAHNHLKEPRRMIIAGDFFNYDAYSKYQNFIPLPNIQQEHDAARNLIANWYATFDEIYMLTGNHERRKLMLLKGQETIQDAIASTMPPNGQIKATVRDRCKILTSQGPYTVLHGASYRKLSLSAANVYAQKFQTHVISHHEHHAAMGMDEYDRYFIINNGGLFDVDKMAYVQLATTTSSGMSKAFTMVRGGYPYLFGKWTNWKEWL